MKHNSLRHKFILPASLFAALLSFASGASAQGTPPRVTLTNSAEAKQLILNQIDTSQFPKVNVFATVLDNGQPVANLTAADFRVREDEVDQEPLTVVPRLTPLSVVVTLDTSGSMSKAIGQAKNAAKSFLDALGAEDQVSIVGFSRTVSVLSQFAADKSAAKGAIDSTVARGDTALYDALYGSVEQLKQRPGRKAIILLSDGVDDNGAGAQLSARSVNDVLALAKTINVPIFTIGLGEGIDRNLLGSIAQSTGAGAYFAPTPEELKGLYDGIGKQLSGQYNILYTSNLPGDGSTHRVQLAQGQLVGVKEYLSPALTKPVAAAPPPPPVTAPVQNAPIAGDPVELLGGASMQNSVLINPDTLYVSVVKASTNPAGQWYGVNVPAGKKFVLFIQRTLNDHNLVTLKTFSPDLKEIESTLFGNRWQSRTEQYLVGREKAGVYRHVISTPAEERVLFMARLVDNSDGGSGTDAGSSESDAVSAPLGSPIKGFVGGAFDPSDYYLVSTTTPGKLKIRYRPSADHGIRVAVSDGDGRTVGTSNSANDGAGGTLEVETKQSGSYLVQINSENTRRKGGAYAFTAGAGDGEVAAPPQPKSDEDPALPFVVQQ